MHKNSDFLSLMRQKPDATAMLWGSSEYRNLMGTVYFYHAPEGVVVMAQISGLPKNSDLCAKPVFGFHIHSGRSCTGNNEDAFADAINHYNPQGCPHPYHAGDMPPLFGCGGYAFSTFLTDRFTIDEIIGRVVIVHSSPDDFTTQPSGNAGKKIACGIINSIR